MSPRRRILRSRRTGQLLTGIITLVCVLVMLGPSILTDVLQYADDRPAAGAGASGGAWVGWLLALAPIGFSVGMWWYFFTQWEPGSVNPYNDLEPRSRAVFWVWPFSFLFPSMGDVRPPGWVLMLFWGLMIVGVMVLVRQLT